MEFQIAFESYSTKHKSKYLALYHALRDAIVGGKLPFGTKLPSSRELAYLYRLSRGTVNQVYEMLSAEGYVESGVGSGTYVAFHVKPISETIEKQSHIRLSPWGQRVERLMLLRGDHDKVPIQFNFQLTVPDTEHFPAEIWNRYMYAQVRSMYDGGQREAFISQGHLPLREAIAAYLRRARGIEAAAGDIVIVNGSMQAIALLVHLLVDAGDTVVVENPGYGGIRRSIEAAGGQLLPVDVDQSGINVSEWQAKLLFVTPSRQFPTGAVLSLNRRQKLLQWASRQGAIIVEDDYDSEFRHHGRPIEPLKALDHEGRVAYIGTFSKTMLPDLRIGYAVLPVGLRETFVKAKQLFEPHPTAIIEQRALAAFINSGQYERHLRRMKRLYSRRYDMLVQLLNAKLEHLFDVMPSDAGLHVFATWKGTVDEWVEYREACRKAGIYWTDAERYYYTGAHPSACFGFSHLSEEVIQHGIEVMQQVWSAERRT